MSLQQSSRWCFLRCRWRCRRSALHSKAELAEEYARVSRLEAQLLAARDALSGEEEGALAAAEGAEERVAELEAQVERWRRRCGGCWAESNCATWMNTMA
eukprot:2265882-Alexandrium_andersonii.AAC.1